MLARDEDILQAAEDWRKQGRGVALVGKITYAARRQSWWRPPSTGKAAYSAASDQAFRAHPITRSGGSDQKPERSVGGRQEARVFGEVHR